MATAQVQMANGVPENNVDTFRESSATGFTAVNGHSPSEKGGSNRDEPKRKNSKGANDHQSTVESSVSPTDDSDWKRQTNGTSHTSTSPADYRGEIAVMSPISRKRSHSDSLDSAEGRTESSYSSQTKHRRIEPMDPSRPRDGTHGHPQSENHVPSQQDFRPAELSGFKDGHDSTYNRDSNVSPGSEVHMAEALQRENQAMDQQQASSYGETPEGAIITIPAQRTKSGDRPPVVQIEKKRKRIFSNRTKSGCLTCRSRKKKCDEGKPECNNCIRGGFQCAGYSQKPTWTKLNYSKQPVPLQSKEGYPIVEQGVPPAPPRDYYREAPPPHDVDGVRHRPIMVEDDHTHRQQFPGSRGSIYHLPSGGPPASETGHHYYPPEQPHHDYQRPGSIHEQSREYPPPPHANSQPAVTAQLALQHPAASVRPPPTAPPVKTEKDKMLAGEAYLPFCNQLIDEREACNAALWRFNHSTNPNSGVSREERLRLFRAVIEGTRLPRRQGDGRVFTGTVGRDVFVEAPFNCEYGYNIHIADDCVIGPNCTILDPCIISIGLKTIIGPNVNIYGLAVSIDPRMRQGSRGQAVGSRVTIGENCWIGGNVTILPKVTIGKGATIGAGSVVTRNVPEFTVVVGNPAHVVRGIWHGMSGDR